MKVAEQKGRRLRITKAQALAYWTRWQTVNAAERVELQATPIAHKLRQLAALMASVKKLGWTESLAGEEAQVRDRWNRLRKAYHV